MPAVGFEQIRHTPKPFSDTFIDKVVSGNYVTSSGATERSLKGYLDNVPADEFDKDFVRDPEKVVAFHNELSDLVADKLSFVAPVDKRELVGSLKSSFTAKLSADKAHVAAYFRDPSAGRYPVGAMDFYGLNIDTAQKGPVDLLDGNIVSNIRANLQMQRNAGGLFVQWTSKKELLSAAQGQSHELKRRIYLNPAIEDSIKIFREIIDQSDAQGLSIKGKIYDRSNDSEVVAKRGAQQEFTLRGDPIVFYATDQEADHLLRIVADVYSKSEASFKGRALSRVPQKVADGIGVGDDPGIRGESLTSHREEALGKVAERVKAQGLDARRSAELFRILWREEATRQGINPDNLAFNAKK